MARIALGSRPTKQVIKAYTDVLQFGKHKGHTIEWILSNHPSYILWLDENGWTIDGQIVLDAEDMDDADYYPYERYGDEGGYGFPSIWDYMGDDNH